MFINVGNTFINLCLMLTNWLTTNFIGAMYMFFVVCIFFHVIYTLGGHNRNN